jgi:hypothetical protein
MGEWTLENILGIQRGTYRPELEQKQGEFSFLDKQYQELGTHSYVQDVLSTKKKLASAEAGSHEMYSVQGWFPSGAASNVKKAKMYKEELSELFKSKDRPIYEQYVQTEKQRSAAKQRIRELEQTDKYEQTEKQYAESQKISGGKIDDVVSFYNRKVEEYEKLPSNKKQSQEGKALLNTTKLLGDRITHYENIYGQVDAPDLGIVKRNFKDVRIANRMFQQQKARKMSEIAGIKDPVEQKLVSERDLPYFEGTEKSLKTYSKKVNIETREKLEDLGAGNQGMIGAPEAPQTPAASPTGTLRVPYSQRMPFNEAPSLPYDPMSRFENYFSGKGNDYGFNTKGMYGGRKRSKGGNTFNWG